MIGPEQRKRDHIKESMEYNVKDRMQEEEDLEKARKEDNEGAAVDTPIQTIH